MLYDEAQALLKRITYKRDWTLELRDYNDFVSLCVTSCVVEDATGLVGLGPGDTTRINIVENQDIRLLDEQAFLMWIDYVVTKLELHESREWLKLDGKPMTPQH